MFDVLKPNVPVGLCSDHAGFELKEEIKEWLDEHKVPYIDFGTDSDASCDYADFAHKCAVALENDVVYPAIAICGSGNGIGMTMNKHQGVRAAHCWCTELGKLARQHNDANALVLGARFIETISAIQIVNAFLSTSFEGGRHQRRIEKIPVDFSKV